MYVRKSILLAAGLAALAVRYAWSQELPLPPGNVVVGPVFKQSGQCPPPLVPSITTGADANDYICSMPPTLSFVPTAPAAMVVTSTPTQYVRVYCPTCSPPSFPNRSFMADPSTIRSLTPAQIKDVLALPSLPTMITIVTVPTGTCVLVAKGAAIAGFGSGGTAQEYAAGIPSGPNCQGLQFLPASDYINQQPIGSYALLYGPRAGGGNAGAVAAALDRGPYPKPFTDMDGIYKSLDLLNFGDPGPLRAALVQLDGEIYADYSSVAVTAGQVFLGAVRTQMHTISQQSAPVRTWLSGVGAGGVLNGNDDTHTLHSAIGGVAGGLERRFSPTLLAGVALGWAGGSFATSGISGSGTFNTFVLTPYVRFAPGPWYVEGVIGYNYNWASVSRDLFFINRDLFSGGTARTTSGRPTGNALLSQVETGYSVALNTRTTFTPFATMQGIVILQNGFAETGGGAVDLHVSNQTTSIAVSTLGAEVAYAIPMWRSAPFRLTARLGWAHDFADTERTATAFLEGTPSAALFTVNGASAMRDAAVFGFGVTRSLPGFDLFLRYEGTASSRASVNGGTAGLRFTF